MSKGMTPSELQSVKFYQHDWAKKYISETDSIKSELERTPNGKLKSFLAKHEIELVP